ncbi:MAG: bifunctional phosphoribosylaminoimidazolecarboxamide formyltransferase/IMP cyclohydrolase [Candidatus Magasanikbacteria bacterium]
MNIENIKIKRALISVSDKTGIVELAQELNKLSVEIISTGGTAKTLAEAGIPVVEISQFTGFPEIMDGRVKTLNPMVHGGILGLRDKHADIATKQNIKWIDLVIVNLYPFAQTIQKPEATEEEIIENIDIGGPSMIRSAAKNIGWVGVVCDPGDYAGIIEEVKTQGGLAYETRKKLSAKAFAHTAQYDAVIANHFKTEEFPDKLTLTFNKYYDLRYGENPHQAAAAYQNPINTSANIINAKILQGKQLSYNNLMDANAAWQLIKEFSEPTCAVIKHSNPCGVAVGVEIDEVFERAYNADALSAFGGIITLNRPCSTAIAEKISKVFAEIVIAPKFEKPALEILAKKPNLRLLETGAVPSPVPTHTFRYIEGGALFQDNDTKTIAQSDLKIATKRVPSDSEIASMLFAWKVLKHIKSNSILIAKDNTTLGVGAGQVSRIDSVDIAIKKAGDKITDAVLASDAYFPFRDSIDKIAATGIKTIIQPGGSIRDAEVIAACDEYDIAMVFTGTRCFNH